MLKMEPNAPAEAPQTSFKTTHRPMVRKRVDAQQMLLRPHAALLPAINCCQLTCAAGLFHPTLDNILPVSKHG